MNANNWQRVKLIFERALELRSEDRLGYIVAECGGDEVLAAEVISLLQADADASGFHGGATAQGPRLGGRTMMRTAGQVPLPGRSNLGGWVGPYQLVDFIASGGMGTVYRAVHGRTGRIVALKMLHQTIDDAEVTRRLLNEAQVLSRLNHPGIATLYELLDSEGRPCLVMEYVDGLTIAQQMKVSGPLQPDHALHVIRKLAAAVGYLHSNGVLHRDIKAENIKIRSSGEIKLLDFGLARDQFATRMTRVGGVMGTLPYMSPELLQMGTPDPRSDVWALGVLLYEMVVGAVPFPAEEPKEVYAQQTVRKRTLPSAARPGVSTTVDVIVKGCLETRPEKRYQHGNAIADAIRQSARTSAPPPVPSRARVSAAVGNAASSGWHYWAVAAAVVIVGVMLFQVMEPADPPKPASSQAGAREDVNAPIAPVVSSGAQPSARSTAREDELTCFSQRPANRDGFHTLTIAGLAGQQDVYYGGIQIGSTPCFIQGRKDRRVSIEVRSQGKSADYPIDFAQDNTYTISAQ